MVSPKFLVDILHVPGDGMVVGALKVLNILAESGRDEKPRLCKRLRVRSFGSSLRMSI
jgi:hypothetical protein